VAELELGDNGETPVAYREQLRAVLRRRGALRQAIVLAEILAAPVALRTSRAWMPSVRRIPPFTQSSP
jgi:hypothetical protein